MNDHLKNEIFLYLEDLLDSNITNMYGAVPYIVSLFEISKYDARKVLKEWMKKGKIEIELMKFEEELDQESLEWERKDSENE
tara:strand:+ start:1409 stop:1654 length:246 start_codon:yes stop_codon:yes gene_type:complete